jgi:hypothetical protein
VTPLGHLGKNGVQGIKRLTFFIKTIGQQSYPAALPIANPATPIENKNNRYKASIPMATSLRFYSVIANTIIVTEHIPRKANMRLSIFSLCSFSVRILRNLRLQHPKTPSSLELERSCRVQGNAIRARLLVGCDLFELFLQAGPVLANQGTDLRDVSILTTIVVI